MRLAFHGNLSVYDLKLVSSKNGIKSHFAKGYWDANFSSFVVQTLSPPEKLFKFSYSDILYRDLTDLLVQYTEIFW